MASERHSDRHSERNNAGREVENDSDPFLTRTATLLTRWERLVPTSPAVNGSPKESLRTVRNLRQIIAGAIGWMDAIVAGPEPGFMCVMSIVDRND